MVQKKLKTTMTILYILVASIATLLLSNVIFGWYIGNSNDAIANSNEIKTVTSGYGGRFTTETDYNAHSSIVYEDDKSVITKAYVKPGDVLFFTFIMEFDSEDGESLKDSTYSINIVLNAGATSTDSYYGVTTGEFNSFLYYTCIPANTVTMSIAKKEEYETEAHETSYKYTVTSSPTLQSSTGVSHFSTTATTSGEVGCSFNVTFPTSMTYPDPVSVDDKIYIMLYLPIFYQDTNSLQNNEMNCYLKFASVIYEKVGS